MGEKHNQSFYKIIENGFAFAVKKRKLQRKNIKCKEMVAITTMSEKKMSEEKIFMSRFRENEVKGHF